jgi:hypothetical protein
LLLSGASFHAAPEVERLRAANNIAGMTEDQLRAQLDAVYASTSWRITAPLRFVSGLIKHRTLPSLRLRQRMRSLLGRAIRNPLFRKAGSAVLRAFPSLREPLHRIARKYASVPASLSPSGLPSAQTEAVLSPQARQILAELRMAHRKSNRTTNR